MRPQTSNNWRNGIPFLQGWSILLDRPWDKPRWFWSVDGVYSVRNAYRHLNDGGLCSLVSNVIWHIRAPLKVKAFLWLVFHNAILTQDNLMKKIGKTELLCLCQQDAEAFFFLFVRSVWALGSLYIWCLFHCPCLLSLFTRSRRSGEERKFLKILGWDGIYLRQ